MPPVKGNKTVRFAQNNGSESGPAAGSVRRESVPAVATADKNNDRRAHFKKRKQDDRLNNEDELDDVDDWRPDDDGDDEGAVVVPSQHTLLEAKRERRTKRTLDGGDDEEEEGDDDDTRIDNRTSLAAEGIEIEPFHMDQERTDGSGYFDGDTYVFRKHEQVEEPDAWLEALNDNSNNNNDNEEDIHRRIVMVREDQRRKQEARESDERMDNWTDEDLYAKLLPNLGEGESVLEALIRYGNLFKQPKKGKEVAPCTTSEGTRRLAQDSFNEVTEAANALLLKGKIDIYQTKRADIEAVLPPPKAVAETKTPAVQWEYLGNEDGQIHGPYSTKEMLDWIRAGYFIGSTAVQVRTVQPVSEEKKSIQDDLLSDLMDDDDHDQEQQSVRGEWVLSDEIDFNTYIK